MLNRRSALLLPLLAAACGRDEPVINLPSTPIGFRHLLPLRLNVADVALAEPPPPAGNDLGARLALPPGAAVRQMGSDRLVPAGSTGQAQFSVTQASVLQTGGLVLCQLGCRLDILGDGGRLGFVEASARAQMTLSTSASANTRQRAAEAMLREALGRLNVEFEFQVRRNLRAWLVEASAAGSAPVVPGAVQREDLAPAGPAPIAAPGAAPMAVPGGGVLQLPR